MIIVTNHAIERYIERVERVTPDVARERLSSPTIQMAAHIGCECVKLGSGARVVLSGSAVLTVVAPTGGNTWKGVSHAKNPH